VAGSLVDRPELPSGAQDSGWDLERSLMEPGERAGDTRFAESARALRQSWNASGAGYVTFAEGLAPAVVHLLDLMALPAGAHMHVLDVATGTGLAAFLAAERGCLVDAVDFAPDLVAEAARLAGERGLANRVRLAVGDAEALPYASGAFDATISTFGVMFALRHEAVVAELARVLRPGGMLGLAAWKPEGLHCRLLGLTVPYAPSPYAGSAGPLDWGCPAHVEALLAPAFTDVEFASGDAPWRVGSVRAALDLRDSAERLGGAH
jgi:SAM-dependent methyltransferase